MAVHNFRDKREMVDEIRREGNNIMEKYNIHKFSDETEYDNTSIDDKNTKIKAIKQLHKAFVGKYLIYI